MSLILSGTDGVSDVDGTAATPALRGTDTNTGIFFPAADTIAFAEGGVESARFDSAGNFGLGVTPSAWSSYRALQIAGGGSLVSFGNAAEVWSNAFFNGSSNLYIANGFATRYHANNNGAHAWYTAPSGTAGNAISFTQAMTLTSLGQFIVGSVNDDARMTISGANGFSGNGLSIYETSTGLNRRLRMWQDSTGFTYNATYSSGGNAHVWQVANAERARLTESGEFLVGTTSLGTVGSVSGSGLFASGYVAGSVANDTPGLFSRRSSDGGIISFRRDTTQVGTVSVTTTSTAYNTSSDYRLKENIQPMVGALAKVAALKPCTYTWKANGSDGEGFIAHELAEVCPHAVSGEKDAVDADGNPVYQGIDTSFLVATLTAAIQELNAKLEAQAAEIAALKGTA